MDSKLNNMMEELFGTNSEDQSFGWDEVEVSSHHTEIPSTNSVENVSSHHTEIPSTNSVGNGPQTGTLYPDVENLFRFYLEHAKHRGFGVIKRTTSKNVDGEYKYSLMTCDRGRKTAPQKTTKIVGCPARVKSIKQDDGSWMVSTVVAEHNHELTPHMSILMSAHINISTNLKRQLEANDIAGIRPCKSVRLAEVQSGGPMNLGWSSPIRASTLLESLCCFNVYLYVMFLIWVMFVRSLSLLR